jgi:mannose-1-phosphate guanylyltransferase/mannose-6-phosphate isomerase
MTSATSLIVVQPVVMAGGSGTRLWPLSRAGYPKQFLVLSGNHSLFQDAVARLARLGGDGVQTRAPLIVGNEEHRFLMLDQLRELKAEPLALLLEPVGRNTAPALTLAALQAMESGDDPVLVVTPADQTVTDADAFVHQLDDAVRLAAEGGIVILGIVPERAETGYGYIRAEGSGSGAAVAQFVEKPDADTAARYLADGGYFWNSGMFVLRASAWLQALERFRPDILQATRAAWQQRQRDDKFVRPPKGDFAAVPAESIDYAVMERCPGTDIALRMVPLAAGWNDLGAWDAVWQVASKDAQGNALHGDTLVRDSRDTLVHATSRLVSVVGLDHVVVVETPDAVLVADRSRSQDVKKIVADLEQAAREEKNVHRKVHRPWAGTTVSTTARASRSSASW